ncbi:translation initiation factor 2 [Methylobacterium sp. D48H]
MTAKPGTTDPKADAGKLASGADSLKPSTGPAAQSAGAKPDPVTAGAASSASDGRTGASPSSSSTASTAASGTSGAKIDPKAAQPGTGPQGGPRPGGPAPGAAGPAAASAVTAGPIIDLKAKRIPDPATAGKEPGKDASRDTAQNTFKDTAKDTSRDGKEPPKGPIPAVAAVDPSRSAAAPAGRARAGFGSLAAAGLLGGVIGAGLLFGAEKAGIGPDPRLSALDQRLSGQLASLDKRLDGLAPRDAVTALDKRVAAAEASAKQALDKSGAAPASTADGQAAGQASGQAPAVPPDLVARLDSLDQRVAALQEEPGQEPGRDQPADSKLGVVQDNAKQIADLETRLKAVEDGGANKGAAEEAARKVAALQSEVEQKTKANAEADAALGQRLDALQQAVDARVKAATEAVQAATQASRTAAEAGQAQAAEAAKAVDRRLQEQADQIAALDKSVAQRAEASTVQAALRVVVADRVAAALESGTSYAEPLATLRKLDPGTDAQAKALAPFADGGAPSAGDLADTFRPIAERIAAKRQAQRAKSAAETGDFRTKLLSMADGLVQIRKADAPAPEAADDPESKVQAALDRGDLPAASAAFAALPAEAREQAGDFSAKLKARAEAEQAVRALLDGAFKALPVGAAQPAQAAPGR